jgi:hypothetical protein
MMARTAQGTPLGVPALFVAVLAVLFLVLGGIWYGVSSEILQRVWQDLTGRPSGPMSFRFFLQPAMAAIAATHDGIRDAQLGRSPYFWTVLSHPAERADRLREGLTSTARIILLGIGMDVIYQLKVFGTFYPVESILIALGLAFVPYTLLRGPIDRIARWWLNLSTKGPTQ